MCIYVYDTCRQTYIHAYIACGSAIFCFYTHIRMYTYVYIHTHGRAPARDVVLTNPPYSADHMALEFCLHIRMYIHTHGRVPAHDVVVTNPPYSGDHMALLFKWLRQPWEACPGSKPTTIPLQIKFKK